MRYALLESGRWAANPSARRFGTLSNLDPVSSNMWKCRAEMFHIDAGVFDVLEGQEDMEKDLELGVGYPTLISNK